MNTSRSPGKDADLPDAAAPRERGRLRAWRIGVEFLSHFDNLLYAIPFAGLVAYGLASGPGIADPVWFVAGWLAFLPQEWLTHVYILHWKGIRDERTYTWMYRLHYGHHDYPKRHDLMYMPLWLTVPMTSLNLGLFWLACPDARSMWAAFAGALGGYLLFEWSHLLCHVPYVPKARIWRDIRDRHLAHHFVTEHRWFSVSPPAQWIDTLARRDGPRSEAARSPTCRFLLEGLDPAWVERARAKFADRSSGVTAAGEEVLPVILP